MKVGMRVEGFAELAQDLEAIAEAPRGRVLTAALKAGGEPIRAGMAARAPREPGAPDLAEHMVISSTSRIGSPGGGRWEAREGSEAAVAIGPAKEFYYGLFQEYGTERHGAQPFARPAFEAGKLPAIGIVRDQLWEAIARRARGRRRG